MYPQIRNGSVKECEVEMVGEECEVYCEDGRRRVARGTIFVDPRKHVHINEQPLDEYKRNP